MNGESCVSADRLEDDGGDADDDTGDGTELGLREPLLPDSVNTSNVGSMTVAGSTGVVQII